MRPASLLFALTLSASLQANDCFPLAIGNWWSYEVYVAEKGQLALKARVKWTISKDTTAAEGIRRFIPVLCYTNDPQTGAMDSSSRNVLIGDRGNDVYLIIINADNRQPPVKFAQHEYACANMGDTCLALDTLGYYRGYGTLKTAAGELQSCISLESQDEMRLIFAPGIGLAWMEWLDDDSVEIAIRLTSYRTQYGATPEYTSADFSIAASQATGVDREVRLNSGPAGNETVRLLIYGPEGRLLTQTTTTAARTADLTHFLNSRTGTFLVRMLMGNSVITRKLTIAR